MRGAEIRAFLIVGRGFQLQSVLMRSAVAYQRLTAYDYKITAGRKGEKTEISLSFPEDAYHHLAGFQYARIQALSEQKTALRRVLSTSGLHEQLCRSGFKHWDRIESLITLQERLESNRFVFHYKTHETPFSRINADYLLTWDNVLFFINDAKPVSIFQSSNDYSRACPKLTVLAIERTERRSSRVEVVYSRQCSK